MWNNEIKKNLKTYLKDQYAYMADLAVPLKITPPVSKIRKKEAMPTWWSSEFENYLLVKGQVVRKIMENLSQSSEEKKTVTYHLLQEHLVEEKEAGYMMAKYNYSRSIFYRKLDASLKYLWKLINLSLGA